MQFIPPIFKDNPKLAVLNLFFHNFYKRSAVLLQTQFVIYYYIFIVGATFLFKVFPCKWLFVPFLKLVLKFAIFKYIIKNCSCLCSMQYDSLTLYCFTQYRFVFSRKNIPCLYKEELKFIIFLNGIQLYHPILRTKPT